MIGHSQVQMSLLWAGKKTEPKGVVEIKPTVFTSLTKQFNLGLPRANPASG